MDRQRTVVRLGLLLLAGAFGCSQDIMPGSTTTPPDPNTSSQVPAPAGRNAASPWDDLFNSRKLDYNLALRTASLKLVGDLPTLQDIKDVQTATDPATVYAQKIDGYLADPRFAAVMIDYFRDAFRTGGQGRDTAAMFAAMVVTQDRTFMDILTAPTGTCPSFDGQSGAFTPGDCGNGANPSVGVLTDPGVMESWYGNMAFRRVRWLQESFVCRKFPTEFSSAPVAKGNGQYTSPWPFESIPGKDQGPVDFRDTSAVVCANCHETMNHIAPLFAKFDDMGQLQGTIQVHVPVAGVPLAQPSDWLMPGEQTSWRYGEPVADLPALGAAMANDPDIAECAVARVWNWAMSKTDIVNDAATVPDFIVANLVTDFANHQFKLKTVIRDAFLSDDFVRF
jgi:hypothetical protein